MPTLRTSQAVPCLVLLAGLLAALLPALAEARCRGTDLMARLARERPAAHAEILARAERTPNGEGVFWRVEAADGARPSYLYGTLHSTEAAARWLPRQALDALAAARLVMVELTPAEQARLQERLATDPRFALDPDGPRLTERLTPEELEAARAALSARGVPFSVADRLKPWLLISTIAIPECEKAELAAGKRLLDDAIAAEAKTWGIPVEGLETYDETFAAFDELTETEMTGLLIDGFSAVAAEEDLRRTLEELYHSGRIAAILEFNIWHAGQTQGDARARAGAEALTKALIAGRNALWIDRLAPEIARGGVFAAFGALHLPGEDGIVALLRARGFQVTRVRP